MSPQTSDPVHVPSSTVRAANICSRIGIAVGLFLLALFGGLELTVRQVEPDANVLAWPFDFYVVAGLLTLIICSVLMQVGLHLHRGQRRLADGQRRLEELMDLRYAEGFADGASGRSAAPILRSVSDRS